MVALPKLDAPWLAWERVRAVFGLLNQEGEEGRAVGGAVRDALLGRPVSEIDFATTGRPDWVIDRAKAAGIKAIPTGIEHGTVTLVVDGHGHEVTTLREDVETDGRHAVVSFGRDWAADARRRDFTMNALSIEADGRLHDPVGGYDDLRARRVRFIGDPDQRIAEDYLRILRFFRFHAQCGEGELDPAGRDAAIRGRNGLRILAAERINHELQRTLVAGGAVEAVTAMQATGILPILLAGIGYLASFGTTVAFETEAGIVPSYPRRLAALSARIVEDVERITTRLRLANADRDAMTAALAYADRLQSPPDMGQAKADLYRFGRDTFTDGLALAAAFRAKPLGPWAKSLEAVARWEPPAFPIGGKDLIAAGVRTGPQLGAILAQLEAWWISEEFRPDRAALLKRCQQISAAQQ